MSTVSENTSLKERAKKLKEEFIVEVAAKLFLSKGIVQTTMDEIAKESGLSKTTVYTIFSSKEDLEILVYKKIHSEKMPYLKAEIEKETNPLGQLRAYCNAYHSFYLNNPKHLEFQLKHDYLGVNNAKLSPEVRIEIRDFFQDDIDYMIEVFEDGITQGIFRKDLDPNIALDTMYLTLRAVLNQTILFDSDNTMDTSSEVEGKYQTFVEIYLKGIMNNENA